MGRLLVVLVGKVCGLPLKGKVISGFVGEQRYMS
jgi:hypothetical protein